MSFNQLPLVFIYLDHAETVCLKPKCATMAADLRTLKNASPPLYIFHTYYQSRSMQDLKKHSSRKM
jgi:hypothetical protein